MCGVDVAVAFAVLFHSIHFASLLFYSIFPFCLHSLPVSFLLLHTIFFSFNFICTLVYFYRIVYERKREKKNNSSYLHYYGVGDKHDEF